MSAVLNVSVLRDGLKRIIDKLETCGDELNALDARLGDGDLGVTMLRGARGVAAELPALPDDLGLALLKCARAFTRLSGSTYGTLLATGLMSAAKATRGRTEVPWTEVPSLLATAGQAMAQRGGGQFGEKTVLDALESASAALQGLSDPAEMVQAANHAVSECLDRFRNLPAKQGRARIFADRSIGLDDPGMVAFARMLEALKS